ncbi:hypothetical protein [Acinetobacter indicus]|uniref:hypothetical protein n=1 Tax=Acinetobacter indicus TaxID=756892 RepID=UPI000CECDC58|nr:hypothetical protein [Acinetobacter indicus]
MNNKIYLSTVLALGLSVFSFTSHASELDQYLQQKQIIDAKYKIKNTTGLNEILNIISVEDSRTLPYQVDQNTIIEQMQLFADRVEVKGLINSPDFEQFAQDVGHSEVKKIMKKNLLQNCEMIFEHQFQRVNPYRIELQLSSAQQQYQLQLKNSECKF